MTIEPSASRSTVTSGPFMASGLNGTLETSRTGDAPSGGVMVSLPQVIVVLLGVTVTESRRAARLTFGEDTPPPLHAETAEDSKGTAERRASPGGFVVEYRFGEGRTLRVVRYP
jgi:hypothetical protein